MNRKVSKVSRVSKGLSALFVFAMLLHCNSSTKDQKQITTLGIPKTSEDEKVAMTLFYPKQDGSGLFQTTVQMDDVKRNPKLWFQQMIDQLIASPSSEALAVFQEKMDLYGLFSDKDILYVDFPVTVQKNFFQSIQMQQLAFDALLASIKANFPYAKQVKFLIQHEDREMIFGHIYAQQPFSL